MGMSYCCPSAPATSNFSGPAIIFHYDSILKRQIICTQRKGQGACLDTACRIYPLHRPSGKLFESRLHKYKIFFFRCCYQIFWGFHPRNELSLFPLPAKNKTKPKTKAMESSSFLKAYPIFLGPQTPQTSLPKRI